MKREEFIGSEDKHVTVRIVSPDDVARPFNRLLNTIPAADGQSLLALEEDTAGALPDMIVKLPESVRRVITKIDAADGFATIQLRAATPDAFVQESPQVEASEK
jgi:hypothetical protein